MFKKLKLNSIGSSRLLKLFKLFNLKIKFKHYKRDNNFFIQPFIQAFN